MIEVQIAKNFKDIDFDPDKLIQLVNAVCARFDLPQATVSIAIVDDQEITTHNARFLNHNFTTDCISFDLSDDTAPARSFELIVNGQMAVRQASLRSHTPQAELALYITHGLLHNLGFDDQKPAAAKKMHETEDKILEQQGFGMVYNESRSGDNTPDEPGK